MVPFHLEQGSGEAIVFLHGIGGDAGCWQPQLDHFGKSRRAIAWDMPGYGRSALLDPMTFPALADALLRLLDDLKIERAHIVGHSVGGMVAIEFGAAHLDRCRSLVLSSTSPAFGSADGSFQRAFLAARLAPIEAGRTPADLAPALVDEMMGPSPDPGARPVALAAMSRVSSATYRATLHCLAGFDRRDALPLLTLPVLALASEHDGNAPPKGMQRMAEKLPSARFQCLADSGHLPNLERPAAFTKAVEDFLDGLS